MDSQRTHIHKANPRVALLFPEWRLEKIQFDDIAPPSGTLEDLEEDLRSIEKPVVFTQRREPAWQETDLRRQL